MATGGFISVCARMHRRQQFVSDLGDATGLDAAAQDRIQISRAGCDLNAAISLAESQTHGRVNKCGVSTHLHDMISVLQRANHVSLMMYTEIVVGCFGDRYTLLMNVLYVCFRGLQSCSAQCARS